MDFRDSLKAFANQRLTAPELIVELDRVMADTPEHRDVLRNQVEMFKRDVGLPQAVYEALSTRLSGAKTAVLTGD